ncbi:MAG: hypothetical protein ABEJ99_05335 [Candidatus Nanohaloarchaea archaeon]
MVEITSEAKQDLKQFEIETREGLLDKIKERLGKDRDNDNISYINKPQFGIEFHRLNPRSRTSWPSLIFFIDGKRKEIRRSVTGCRR